MSIANTDEWLTEQELLDAGMTIERIKECERLHLLQKEEKENVVKYRQTYLCKLLANEP